MSLGIENGGRRGLATLLAGALGIFVVLSALAQGGGQNAFRVPALDRGRQVVPDRYIVQLRPGVEPVEGARRLAEKHGLRTGPIYRYALNGFAAVIPAVRLESLRREPTVLLVEPDLIVHATDQLLPTGIDRIDADLDSVAKINGLDERVDVDIAIIDTGSGPHPDLNVVARTDCTADFRPCMDDDGSHTVGVDDHGHGTYVAGIGAALDNDFGVVGVAPGARLWSVKVFTRNGFGRVSWTLAAIDWVTQHASEIKVANMSVAWWGNSHAARAAIQNSVASGVVYVAAASNEAIDIYGPDQVFGTGDEIEPASYPECATVSALADSDGITGGVGPATFFGSDDTLATFSNFSTNVIAENPVLSPGAAIDVAAPGVDIVSTYLDGAYAIGSGTSASAPHAAGAIGLYIAANGRASTAFEVAFIRQQIINQAQPQSAWGPASTRDPDANHEGLVRAGCCLPPPPFAPSGLTATAASSRHIVLSWLDNSDNEEGFKIERCLGSGCTGFTLIAHLGANATSYGDTRVGGSETYAYRVRAFNGGGHSTYSNTSEATTPAFSFSCQGGCDDGNPCTKDRCDSSPGRQTCAHTPQPGTSCDDGSACTTSDACTSDGICAGTPVNCDDANLCTLDRCDPLAETCLHDPITCSDGNQCTQDSCDPTSGCRFDPTPGAPCDDGVPCTLGDVCALVPAGAATCRSGPFRVCDDGTVCTQDYCDQLMGGCVNHPLICDDFNACTLDSCDAREGCVHVRAPAPDPPPGRRIIVGDDGLAEFQSIQAAIDDPGTMPGDVVSVAPGTYFENISLKCGVNLLGAGHATTTLDGGGWGSVVRIVNCCADTRLQGFTITNGYVLGGAEAGAGVQVYGGAPIITLNRITGNQAAPRIVGYYNYVYGGYGGGLSSVQSDPLVSQNIVDSNSARIGGGIFVFGGTKEALITRNQISGNWSDYGGGVEVFYAGPTISNNLITGNYASMVGGGLDVYVSYKPGPRITNNTIAGNRAYWLGGGAAFTYSEGAETINNIFQSNTALEGGGLHVQGVFRVANNVFHLNSPESCTGYDAWLCGGFENLIADPLLVNPAGGDYRLGAGSSAIDSGMATNAPPDDLRGQRRPLDGDSDGKPGIDRGAFEYDRDDVLGLRFASGTLLTWDAIPSATSYHVYSGGLDALRSNGLDACRDDEDADRSDLLFTETLTPEEGTGLAYVVTVLVGGAEGSPGWTSWGFERTLAVQCP